jgi:hypothetical protein
MTTDGLYHFDAIFREGYRPAHLGETLLCEGGSGSRLAVTVLRKNILSRIEALLANDTAEDPMTGLEVEPRSTYTLSETRAAEDWQPVPIQSEPFSRTMASR